MTYYEFWLTRITYLDLMAEQENLHNLLEITQKQSVKDRVNEKLNYLYKQLAKIEKADKAIYI